MTQNFFAQHQALLEQAVSAISTRGFWSPYPEVPSQKFYGEGANEAGKAVFEHYLHHPFGLPQQSEGTTTGNEISPYGFSLGISYPKTDSDTLIRLSKKALAQWRRADPEHWAGVCLEILDRLNKRSFEMAYAVMHTTGQAFAMAFQAGGPHAQDRGLEAVATAWHAIRAIPKTAYWEKPQGKHAPLQMEKHYHIVPRGIGLVIGCSTFPTWNSYSGFFANLATGNTVIVKPHPGAILPLAITVSVAREVLEEAGFDPNVVMLAAHDETEMVAQTLAMRPEVKLIDFTGSTTHGEWLEKHATHAKVYTEKAGVNQIIIDSTDDVAGMARNIAFSLSLYSGQMCTAPQNIYIPKDGITTEEGHLTFDQVVSIITDHVKQLISDPAKAVDILGAIQNQATVARIANARKLGEIVLNSDQISHPHFPDARIYTPLLISMSAQQRDQIMQEYFGPITFFVATNNTQHSIEIAREALSTKGAITLSAYCKNQTVTNDLIDLAIEGAVALSLNLTSTVYVNQSAGFSDFHGTGGNAASNCALTDAAFVTNRFYVVQHRQHVSNT